MYFKGILENAFLSSKHVVNVIERLCSPCQSIEDLFISRFCTALSHDLISFSSIETNYRSNGLNENDSRENRDSIESIQIQDKKIEALDFFNYEHTCHKTLKTLLSTQYSSVYDKYCQYLNRLVLQIILNLNQLKDLPSFTNLLSQVQQNQIIMLSKNYTLDKDAYILFSSVNTHKELLDFISKSLIKVNISYNHFYDAINLTMMSTNTLGLESMIKYASNLNIANKFGKTPLIHASSLGHIKAIVWLVEQGAEVDYADKTGKTALFFASISGKAECVRKLIEFGANVNSQNTLDNWTAQMFAIQNCHFECVKLLLEHDTSGACINFQNREGLSALMFSTLVPDFFECVDLLVESGANVNHQNNLYNWNALMYSIKFGFNEHISKLISYGSHIDEVFSTDGMSALMFASQLGRTEMAILLIDSGHASVNLLSPISGMTALMYASMNGDTKIIQALVNRGALLNVKDFKGRTALIQATKYHNKASIKLLLELGADIHIKDNNGKEALQYANNNEEIISLFKKTKPQKQQGK